MTQSKIRTEWNLGLLYKSDKDPAIERDLKRVEKASVAFEKKYKNFDFTSTPEKLSRALKDHDKLEEVFNGNKPHWYFSLKTSLNSSDSKAEAVATKYDGRLTHARNKLKFFFLKISKIDASKQNKFLKHKSLASFSYQLERVFKSTKYRLTEQEEQLADLLSQPGYDMWVDGQEKVQNEQTVGFKGKEIPISEASNKVAGLLKKERRDLNVKITEKLKSISHFAEAEINAVYNFKKIMDERRGYQNPYSATMLGYENDEKSIENLISLITKNFKISNKFYKLHAKLLKERKITIADRNVKIGKINKTFEFKKSIKIVRDALNKVSGEFGDIFDSYLKQGQIDTYPKKGKRGGAFCSGRAKLPTFILLNHVNTIDSVETLGHEMGHAIHTEMSKPQPVRYRHYSIATAEVASTFFEQVVQDEIEKELSDKEKVIMLHNKILGDVQTIFRQITCFNFELELHNKIRKEGQVPKNEIANLLSKHLKLYLGEAVSVTDDDGYFFVSWSHIRNFFYVYSYAYGQLISKALFANWKKDPSYAEKIKQFLRAGRSMSPEDIFKSIGIDTSKPEFFKAGLRSIDEDINRLKKLTK